MVVHMIFGERYRFDGLGTPLTLENGNMINPIPVHWLTKNALRDVRCAMLDAKFLFDEMAHILYGQNRCEILNNRIRFER